MDKSKLLVGYLPGKRDKDQNIIPCIKLTGKWLRNYGFDCGDYVEVTKTDNKIIIELLPEEEIQRLETERLINNLNREQKKIQLQKQILLNS